MDITRRCFIRTSAAYGVAGVSRLSAAQDAPNRTGMRLAFQVYGVRDLCAKDFPATLRAVRAIGYEGVETGRFYGRDAKALAALMRDCGLKLVSLQLYPHVLAEPQLSSTIRFCHESGCHRINTAWFKGSAENVNDWQLAVNVINHAAEVCAKEGVEIGYHNHDQEFLVRFDGKPVLEWMYERFSPQVKQEFDAGWCVIAGGDPFAWLKAHPHRNPCVHVMPSVGNGKSAAESREALPPPGECGVGSANDKVDWKRLLPAMAADGTEWLVVKPTSHPDSVKDIKASFEAIRKLV